MSHRQGTRLSRDVNGVDIIIGVVGAVAGAVAGGTVGVVVGGVIAVVDDAGGFSGDNGGALVGVICVLGFLGVIGALVGGCLVGLVGLVELLGAGLRLVRDREARSSDCPGGAGELQVSRSGTARGVLPACTSVDRLVDYLLDRAVDTLPAAARDRFAEEWRDHRQYYSGWRLVWWALCVRATVLRTTTALGPARLSREG